MVGVTMRLAHKYKGLAEQLLLKRDVIRLLSIPLCWHGVSMHL